MADYAGAVAAIKAKFVAEWVEGSGPKTRVALVNESPPDPWPPKSDDGELLPYVLLAIEGAGSGQTTFGTPNNQGYVYDGLIYVHVYVPVGNGTDIAAALAVAAGEIFRRKQFYSETPPYFVRSHVPRVDGGGPGSDDGIWFRVTATIPFEFYYRG